MSIDITVVIPTYNAATFIDEAIGSVLKQTVVPDEIIVVDDASTDDTAARVRCFGKRVKLITLQQNSGNAGTPRNVGFEAARNEYVAQFDADDVMLPRKIERHLLSIKKCRLPAYFHDFEFFGPRTRSELSNCNWNPYFRKYLTALGENVFSLRQEDILDSLLHQYCVGASTLLISKEAWKEVGGYNLHLPSAEDFDFVMRLAERYPFGYIDEVLLRYRAHYAGKMANTIENYTYSIDLRRAYLRRPMQSATRRAMLRLLSEFEIELAWQHGAQGRKFEACRHWWRGVRDGGFTRRILRDSRKLGIFLALKALRRTKTPEPRIQSQA